MDSNPLSDFSLSWCWNPVHNMDVWGGFIKFFNNKQYVNITTCRHCTEWDIYIFFIDLTDMWHWVILCGAMCCKYLAADLTPECLYSLISADNDDNQRQTESSILSGHHNMAIRYSVARASSTDWQWTSFLPAATANYEKSIRCSDGFPNSPDYFLSVECGGNLILGVIGQEPWWPLWVFTPKHRD